MHIKDEEDKSDYRNMREPSMNRKKIIWPVCA
jgi:hypothetical protein